MMHVSIMMRLSWCKRVERVVVVWSAGPPTIVQGEMTQTVNVDEGHNATMSCAATGYPAPNISWVRVNGEALPPPYNRFAYKVFTFSTFPLS